MNGFPYDICYVFYLLGVKNEQILEVFNERMVVVGPNFVPYSIVYSTNTFYCYSGSMQYILYALPRPIVVELINHVITEST